MNIVATTEIGLAIRENSKIFSSAISRNRLVVSGVGLMPDGVGRVERFTRELSNAGINFELADGIGRGGYFIISFQAEMNPQRFLDSSIVLSKSLKQQNAVAVLSTMDAPSELVFYYGNSTVNAVEPTQQVLIALTRGNPQEASVFVESQFLFPPRLLAEGVFDDGYWPTRMEPDASRVWNAGVYSAERFSSIRSGHQTVSFYNSPVLTTFTTEFPRSGATLPFGQRFTLDLSAPDRESLLADLSELLAMNKVLIQEFTVGPKGGHTVRHFGGIFKCMAPRDWGLDNSIAALTKRLGLTANSPFDGIVSLDWSDNGNAFRWNGY
jgi:hypothetical protein